ASDIGNRTLRRVLHRDAAHARDEAFEACFELVAAGVPLRRARQVRQSVALDRVHEAARLASGGNQVIPPPGCEMSALLADAGYLDGDRVQAAEVVQEPSVNPVGFERRLHAGDIHQTSIAWLRRYNR